MKHTEFFDALMTELVSLEVPASGGLKVVDLMERAADGDLDAKARLGRLGIFMRDGRLHIPAFGELLPRLVVQILMRTSGVRFDTRAGVLSFPLGVNPVIGADK